jgi:GDP-L-fucose synthase
MDISCILVNGIVGPNMNFKKDESILPASLIRRFYENNMQGKNLLEVWGDGTPTREYTYSGDLAKAALWCLREQKPNTLLNIGSNEKISVRECAESICEFLRIDKDRLYFNKEKSNGRLSQSTDNSKFLELSKFNFKPFRYSIKEAIDWYVQRKETREFIKE